MIKPIDIADSILAIQSWIELAEHRMKKLGDVDQREVKRIVSKVKLRLDRLRRQIGEIDVPPKKS